MHEKFHYRSLEELKARAEELGVYLPFSEDTAVLFEEADAGDAHFHNRLGPAPMEGADAEPDGSPVERAPADDHAREPRCLQASE